MNRRLHRGRVSRLFPDKQYGFIRLSVVHADVFFHETEVLDDRHLRLGDCVEFTVAVDPAGRRYACAIRAVPS